MTDREFWQQVYLTAYASAITAQSRLMVDKEEVTINDWCCAGADAALIAIRKRDLKGKRNGKD